MFVLLPFLAFGVIVSFVAFSLNRNIRRTTRATGTVVAKRFVPGHGATSANGSPNGGRAFATPDSWVLDIERDGKAGNAVVSQEVFDRIEIGDFYAGE